jgi:hypothetical protein
MIKRHTPHYHSIQEQKEINSRAVRAKKGYHSAAGLGPNLSDLFRLTEYLFQSPFTFFLHAVYL